jgi:trk system potassium uptake protein TrkA
VQKKKVLVICLNDFGLAIVAALWEGGAETVAVDSNPAAVDEIKDLSDASFVGDPTDADVLKGVAVDVDAAVVAFGEEFEAAVLVVAGLKKLGVKEIVARATTPTRGDVLRAVGATRIVQVEREMAIHVAADVVSPVSADVLELSSAQYVRPWPVTAAFVGKRIDAESLRRRHDVAVFGWFRPAGAPKGEKPKIEPAGPDYTPRDGDVLLLAGEMSALRRFVKAMQE